MVIRYMPRTADAELSLDIEAMGAVLITGPKGCGKTTTAMQVAKSVVNVDDLIMDVRTSGIGEIAPESLLRGERPHLIDEWQLAPKVWDLVRREVDSSGETGAFILTGSTATDFRKVVHSGIGRIGRLHMRTMSLYESGDSSGDVSLGSLFRTGDEGISGYSDCDAECIARLLTRGGWPAAIGKSEAAAQRIVEAYCESMIEGDVRWPDGHRHSPEKMRAVLSSLARNSATSASRSKILKDVEGHGIRMHENTLDNYIRDLRKTFVIEDLDAWCPRLRSKTSVNSSPTRHLTDPAIAAWMLDAHPEDLLSDLETFGLLFESMAVHDLRSYSQAIGGKVHHYRDSEGLESDTIIHLNNGRWAAVEIKLGSEAGIESGAKSLRSLERKVDGAYRNKLAFKAIVTATKAAYTRDDGIHVVPLACLRP